MFHKNNPLFFKRKPRDWSLSEYLSSRHPRGLTPRQILDRWRKSLCVISTCTSSCCNDAQRLKANDLIARYDELGNGSDRHFGHSWLAQKAPAAAAAAIHIGPVYQGPVVNAPFTQTNNNPPNTAINQNQNEEICESSDYEDQDQDQDPSSTGDIGQDKDSELEEATTESPTHNTSEDLSATRASFMNAYTAMDRDCKWVLAASGRTVEDVVFDACQAMDDEFFANSLAQSFVIDLADPTIEGWFEKAEWNEIQSHVPPLPQPDVLMIKSMRRFLSVKTTDELRNVLRTTDYLPADVVYDRNIHYNSQWVDLVTRMILILFEDPGEPLRASYHLEDWYTSNVWSLIIDHCLLDLRGMTIERKESPCRATSVRKNRNRTMTGKANRLKTGRRLDAIIKTVEDDYHEYGGMEVARSYCGVTSSKWLGDSFKLAKALRDMLFRLHILVDHNDNTVKKLQVVGVFNAGLAFQLARMNHPNGYVCLLQREKLQQVPTGIQDLVQLLHLLKSVSQMKQIIKDSVAAVANRYAGKTEAEAFQELMEGGVSDKARLGWAADTP